MKTIRPTAACAASLTCVARAVAVATGMFVVAASAMADPTFASTTASVGSVDAVWKVAAEHGGYNDGLSRFEHILSNVTFGDAYAWRTEGAVTMLANNVAGNNDGMNNFMYFIFRQTFDLSGYDPATVDLRFRWASDDVYSAVGWTPAISLNGSAPQMGGTSGAYALGDVVQLNSGFKPGLNTLDFYVEGNGQTDGFALSTQSFSVAAVPEPSAGLLMALGLGVLVAGARRRRAGPERAD